MINYVSVYSKSGFDLNIDIERLVARCDRPSKRARLGLKNEFNYRFRSVERMEAFLSTWIDSIIANKNAADNLKKERLARDEEAANAVKIGDLYVDSWGYEQTNVDFYEVVGKPSAKTVIVRKISSKTVEGSEGMMCDRVLPVAIAAGKEMKKRLGQYGSFKTSSFSFALPTTASESHYRSWYY